MVIDSLESLTDRWNEVARGPVQDFPGIEDVLGAVADMCDDNSWEPSEVASLLRAVAADLVKVADSMA